MLPGVPSSDSGFASPGHAPVSSSRRVAPTSSAEVRTRSASWDGYQTSFQPSHFPSEEEDTYRAPYGVYSEFHGSSRYVHPVASTSASPLTNDMDFFGSLVPSPPPIPLLSAPEGSGMAVPMDPSRDMLAQPYASSQGTESLAVEEMQEVEL